MYKTQESLHFNKGGDGGSLSFYYSKRNCARGSSRISKQCHVKVAEKHSIKVMTLILGGHYEMFLEIVSVRSKKNKQKS